MLKGCLIAIGVFVAAVILLVVFVFTATSGAADAADSLLALIADGKTKEAYESTAPVFRDATSEAEFVAFVEKLGLKDYESANWNSRHIKNNTAQLGGMVKAKAGRSIPLTFDLVKLDGEWKVIGFKSPAAAGGATGSGKLSIPPTDELEALAQSSVMLLHNAIQAKDFTAFHAGVARRWQAQTQPADLQASFQSFVDKGTDLSSAGTVKPILGKPPVLGDDGVLILEGAFPGPPLEIGFTLKYMYEHPAWRLVGINASTR